MKSMTGMEEVEMPGYSSNRKDSKAPTLVMAFVVFFFFLVGAFYYFGPRRYGVPSRYEALDFMPVLISALGLTLALMLPLILALRARVAANYVARGSGISPLVGSLVFWTCMSIMVFFSFLPAVQIVNGALDFSQPTCHETRWIDKCIPTTRNSRGSASVSVESWRPGRKEEDLDITSSLYRQLEENSVIEVCTKKGRLGLEWVRSVRVVHQAISDHTKALEINPRYADAYNNRRAAYSDKDQHDRAISDDTKAHQGEYRIRTTHYIVAAGAFLIAFLLLKKLFTSPFRERNRPLKCKTCGSPLVDGPYVERHGGNDHFKCTVKGIPTKVCPHGCPGTYSYQPDFSDEVLDAIYEDSQNIAKGRLRWSKERQFCRRCDVELTYKGQRAQFVFHQKIKKGTETEVTIEAPCLECTRCGSKYLPSEPGDDDSYHDELNNVIAGVVNQELIILPPTDINRFVTLPLGIILLTVFLTFLGLPVSRWVANHKADEIMRPAFDEGWVRRTTWLALAGAERSFQPRWVVQYENTSTRVFVGFGPQFRINLLGAIIYTSPEDLGERIRRNKLRVEQAGPPDAPYDSKGQDDQAILDYTRALWINPRNAEFYFGRGIAYANKGQLDQAISDCTKALEINPRHDKAYNNRGIAYAKIGQLDQAISDCTKALEINPRNADFYFNRGIAYANKGQLDQAVSDFTKGLEINPRYAEAYNTRGILYDKKGQYDQAILDYIKALEISRTNADAYNNRGIAYSHKGQHDQAISDCTKALEINPRNAAAYNNRGIAYFHKREYEKSWKDVEKARSLGYQIDPEFLDNLRKASGRKN